MTEAPSRSAEEEEIAADARREKLLIPQALLALGIVGLELMIGASVAVALVHKLNYRRFRKAHIGGTYAGAALTWLHVLTTSPEARAPGLVGITVAAAAAACILLGVLRLLPASREDRSRISLTAAA